MVGSGGGGEEGRERGGREGRERGEGGEQWCRSLNFLTVAVRNKGGGRREGERG